MKNKLENFPFFFVTIPLFFLLYNNNYYFGLLEWWLLGSEFILYAVLPVLLFLLFSLLTRSQNKTAVIIACLMILFYFFQPIQDFFKSTPIPVLGRYFVLIPLLALSFAALVLFVTISKQSFRRPLLFINVLFILLVMYELSRTVYYSASGYIRHQDLADRNKKLANGFQPCDTCMLPDIYFFIFDEYTNHKTLQSQFHYANEGLIKYLKEKGFYVAPDSKSNYNQTHISLSSEMNLKYLAAMYNGKQYYARDFLRGTYTLYHNELIMMLKKQGYDIKNYSIFDLPGAPMHSPRPFEEEFLPVIFNQTLLKKMDMDIGWNFRTWQPAPTSLTKEQKQKVERDLNRFKETSAGVLRSVRRTQKKPVFTYAHFLLPHRPYYFDSTGKRLADSLAHEYAPDNNHGYLQQVVYVNNFIIKPLVDSIFKASSRPFIIILQGDHGFRGWPPEKKELAFENLNTFYFHDKDYSQLYPAITSVNTFRVVFNKYFGTNFLLLKDSTFYLHGNTNR
jgi:hypothetical protein